MGAGVRSVGRLVRESVWGCMGGGRPVRESVWARAGWCMSVEGG